MLPARLPSDDEWDAAYSHLIRATAAWQEEDSPDYDAPRVEDFLPEDAGGEGLTYPPNPSHTRRDSAHA